jgi:hypothetical protein
MTAGGAWHKENRHPEEARSAVSKDAPAVIQPSLTVS